MAKPPGYDESNYIHFTYKGKDKKDMVEISLSDIEKLNLNKQGENIPYTFRNTIDVERYVVYYWLPFIKTQGIMLYYHLWEYCDKDLGTDICYPKMNELSKRVDLSLPTLRKYLDLLEKYNFVLQIHRLDKKNGNRETSPIYKLRSTVPLLSRELYHQLPKFLKAKHDDYMERFAQDVQMEHFSYDSKLTFEKLKESGDIMVSNRTRKAINKAIEEEEQYEYLLKHLDDDIKQTLILSEDAIKEIVDGEYASKPTSEIYLKDSYILYHPGEKKAFVLLDSEARRDFLLEVTERGSFGNQLHSFLINRYERFIAEDMEENEEWKIEIIYQTVKEYIIKSLKNPRKAT